MLSFLLPRLGCPCFHIFSSTTKVVITDNPLTILLSLSVDTSDSGVPNGSTPHSHNELKFSLETSNDSKRLDAMMAWIRETRVCMRKTANRVKELPDVYFEVYLPVNPAFAWRDVFVLHGILNRLDFFQLRGISGELCEK